ncbi:MAG: hypothetical protein F4243_02970 [Chloroflexi bacterium]|nr:hypothetical protein [Chloroflexota bacterium]
MDWGQILANVVPVITIVGAFLLWLKNDIKQLRDDMNANDKRLRDDMDDKINQLRDDMDYKINQLRDVINANDKLLRDDMNAGFAAQEQRLRRVEMEQARMAGLLEGMALTGRLPDAGAGPRQT